MTRDRQAERVVEHEPRAVSPKRRLALPWNRILPDAEMRLIMCASLRKMLKEGRKRK